MAGILLELWALDFDSIRSRGKGLSVDSRPLILELNELMRTCGLKESIFASRVYSSSTDYIASLLDLQSSHLEQQQNSIYDDVACREKYACRHLMKAAALNFIDRADNHGPFKLFCDDLCPGNVLVNDSLQVTGVIDWEFCYAAPAQFTGSIPWWLLLDQPHTIIDIKGAGDFLAEFLPKAEVFLQALEQREEVQGTTTVSNQLSQRMRESIRNKFAWFTLACRLVSSVDLIYWELLDEYC